MRWVALAVQLTITIGVAAGLIWALSLVVFIAICGGMFAGVALWLVVRELNDAGGELISFPRLLECLGMATLIGLLWPIVPIVFAWADYRGRADADERDAA